MTAALSAAVRVGHLDDNELSDVLEVAWIAGIERQGVGDGGGRDERVLGARGGFLPGTAAGGCHAAERASCAGVERDGLEIGLGLLKMRLACGPYLVGTRNQRPDR